MAPKSPEEEFVSSVPNFSALPPAQQIPYLVYYVTRVVNENSTSARRIEQLRTFLRLAKYERISQHLSERAKTLGGKELLYVKLDGGYALVRDVEERIRAEIEARPTAVAIAKNLRASLGSLTDPDVRSYLEEAVGCFEAQFFRASIVFTWCAAYSVFRQWIFANHLVALNTQMSTWNKPKQIFRLDDFQEILEGLVIETTYQAKIVTKEQYKKLKKLLDERNSYAHPSNQRASTSMAEAFIENCLNEIVAVFK